MTAAGAAARPRLPTWDGGFNIADLGGLPLLEGGETAYGRVFRSGAPEWLTEAGWAAARADGLATVIDLRAPREAVRDTALHPAVAASALGDVAVVSAPTEDPDDERYEQFLEANPTHPDGWRVNLALWPHRVAAAFTAIARASGTRLVHCAAGRDRTGMIVALLLQLAGVEPDAIVDDWVDAARRVRAHRDLHPRHAREPQLTVEQLESHVPARRAALLAWLDESPATQRLRSIGVDAADIARLRALLK